MGFLTPLRAPTLPWRAAACRLSVALFLALGIVTLGVATLAATPAAAQPPRVEALLDANDVDGLRELGPSVVSEVVARYRVADEDGRAHLAWVLYRLGFRSREAKDALMEDVHTSHQNLRIWSQYALGRVSNDDDVVDVLFENMTRGESWLFRDKAACSLANDQIHLTEKQRLRLLARLISALDDQDAQQRDLAIRVLETQTGQRRGYDPNAQRDERLPRIEDWWRWWNVYKVENAALEDGS